MKMSSFRGAHTSVCDRVWRGICVWKIWILHRKLLVSFKSSEFRRLTAVGLKKRLKFSFPIKLLIILTYDGPETSWHTRPHLVKTTWAKWEHGQVHGQLTSQSIPLLWSSSWATWRWAALVLECWKTNKQTNNIQLFNINCTSGIILVVSKQWKHTGKFSSESNDRASARCGCAVCGQSAADHTAASRTRRLLLIIPLNVSTSAPNSQSLTETVWSFIPGFCRVCQNQSSSL